MYNIYICVYMYVYNIYIVHCLGAIVNKVILKAFSEFDPHGVWHLQPHIRLMIIVNKLTKTS